MGKRKREGSRRKYRNSKSKERRGIERDRQTRHALLGHTGLLYERTTKVCSRFHPLLLRYNRAFRNVAGAATGQRFYTLVSLSESVHPPWPSPSHLLPLRNTLRVNFRNRSQISNTWCSSFVFFYDKKYSSYAFLQNKIFISEGRCVVIFNDAWRNEYVIFFS